MTGICGLECEEPEDGCATLCEPGFVRPEGVNCSYPCEACSQPLPENSVWVDGCVFGCADGTFLGGTGGTCKPCTVCTTGQFVFTPCQPRSNTDCRNCPAQVLPQYGEYTGEYDFVNLRCIYQCKGNIPNGNTCRCPEGKYINGSLQCTECSECGNGTFVTTPCGLDTDTVCEPCSVCPENSWETRSCRTVSGDTECAVCTECSDGTFPVTSCLARKDRECRQCTECGLEQYETSPCNPFVTGANRACSDCSTCVAGEYVNRSCGSMEDTICKPCRNLKPGGSEWTGQFVGGECEWECLNNFVGQQRPDGSWTCTVCREGYYMVDRACVACSTCPTGEEVAVECNANANTECKPCTKPNASFFDPLPHHACNWQCNPGWFQQDGNCTACSEVKATVENAVYTNIYNETLTGCEWNCAVGFSGKERGVCECSAGTFDTAAQACIPCGRCDPETQILFAECTPKEKTRCIECPNQKPASAMFTGEFDQSAFACLWECVGGWTLHNSNLLAPLEELIQNASNASNSSSGLQCLECSVCALGEYKARNCSVTEDTHCEVCPNVLPINAHWTGSYDANKCGWECIANASVTGGQCECISGFRLLDGRCEPCSRCPLGERELFACNEANETVCTPCANALPADAMYDGGYDPGTDLCSWMCVRGWSLFRTNITVTPPPIEPVESTGYMDHNTSTTPPTMTTPAPMEVWVESCVPCSTCPIGEYVKQECQPTADTVCDVCPNQRPPRARFTGVYTNGFCEWECRSGAACFCGAGEFWDQNFNGGECRMCSTCPLGMYTKTECQDEADTVCENCPNTLPPHEVFTGEYHPEFKKCTSVCYEGWERYDPFAIPTPPPVSTSGSGNESLSNTTVNMSTNPGMVTSPPPAPLPPMLPASPYNESHPPPCTCRESKIETADGECNFCRQCPPGTLLDRPCNATYNEDTGCKSCPNTNPVSSSWVPSVNGTALAFDGSCDWKCWHGLTQLTRDGVTLCRCLGTPSSCGYCPILPANATTVGSWCTAFQVLFDGSCRAKPNSGVILNVIFSFADWNTDGFAQKRVAFKTVVAGVLGVSDSKITVDIKNIKRVLREHAADPLHQSAHLLALPQRHEAGGDGRTELRATPLTVPTFLDQVSITSLLGMMASPDVLNEQLTAEGIPPVTGMTIGNSTTLDLTPREAPLNDTNVTAPFVIKDDSVATPIALIISLAGGFFGLCICSGIGYGLYKLNQRVRKIGADCVAYAKQMEEEDEMIEKYDREEKEKKRKRVQGTLGFMKKKNKAEGASKKEAAPSKETGEPPP